MQMLPKYSLIFGFTNGGHVVSKAGIFLVVSGGQWYLIELYIDRNKGISF